MSQDHHHPHSHSSHSRSWNPFSRLTTTQRIAAVIAIATALLITEVVIGFRNRSLALVADAFHITSDLIGYIVALVAVRMGIAGKVSPAKYSFGYQRAALLGGFFNGAFLLALGVSIILQSIERFIQPNHVLDPILVLAIGAAGVGSNILMVMVMGGHAHGAHASPVALEGGMDAAHTTRQDHGEHAHSRNQDTGKKRAHDLNTLGILIHILGDALNSVAVIISAGVYIATGFVYADPIASTFVGFMIIGTSYPLITKSGKYLLEKAPEDIDIEGVKADVERISGKDTVHELHVWNLTQSKVLASMHLSIGDMSIAGFTDLSDQIRQCLHYWKIHNAAIQPELDASSLPPQQDPHDAIEGPIFDFPPAGVLSQRLACRVRCRTECEEAPCCEL